jgi:hypothetical protein
MNQRIFVRRLIYDLKRRYGRPVDVYNNTDAAPVDTTTGRRAVTRVKYHIRRAVVVPKQLNLTQLFTPPFTHSAGRQFQLGGFFAKELTTLLIDGADLPAGVVVTDQSQFIFNGKRYESNHVENLEGLAYLVLCQRCEGTPRDAVFDPPIYDSLRFVESASAEIL